MKLADVLQLFFGYGAPTTGEGVMDVIPTAHAPSATDKKPVPSDEPMEEDDEFFDVTKREAHFDTDDE